MKSLKIFLESLQRPEGSFTSENPVKATAEYLLVHQLSRLEMGDPERARKFLSESLPVFALQEVGKGVETMETVVQIATGIPEYTKFLSEKFLDLSLSGLMPDSVKSSLLLVLLLQRCEDKRMEKVVEDIKDYQGELVKTVSLNSLYETAHNVMAFFLAQERYEVDNILLESCQWLSRNVFAFEECIDLLAEAAAVSALSGHFDRYTEIVSEVLRHQNKDNGFPVFAGRKSEFHPSLVTLWTLVFEPL